MSDAFRDTPIGELFCQPPVPPKRRRGRKPGGPRKLDTLDVQIIREKAPYTTQAALARFFDVSPSLISKILSGKTWAHVRIDDDDRPSDIGTWRMVS